MNLLPSVRLTACLSRLQPTSKTSNDSGRLPSLAAPKEPVESLEQRLEYLFNTVTTVLIHDHAAISPDKTKLRGLTTQLTLAGPETSRAVTQHLTRLVATVSDEMAANIIQRGQSDITKRLDVILPRSRNLAIHHVIKRILKLYAASAANYALKTATRDPSHRSLERLACGIAEYSLSLGMKVSAAFWNCDAIVNVMNITFTAMRSHGATKLSLYATSLAKTPEASNEVALAWITLRSRQPNVASRLTSVLLKEKALQTLAELLPTLAMAPNKTQAIAALKLICDANCLDIALPGLFSEPSATAELFRALGDPYKAHREATARYFITEAQKTMRTLEPRWISLVEPVDADRERVQEALQMLQMAQIVCAESPNQLIKEIHKIIRHLEVNRPLNLSRDDELALRQAYKAVQSTAGWLQSNIQHCQSLSDQLFAQPLFTLWEYLRLLGHCIVHNNFLNNLRQPDSSRPDTPITEFAAEYLMEGDRTGKHDATHVGLDELQSLRLFHSITMACPTLRSSYSEHRIDDLLSSSYLTALIDATSVWCDEQTAHQLHRIQRQSLFTLLKMLPVGNHQLITLGWAAKPVGHCILGIVEREPLIEGMGVADAQATYSLSLANSGSETIKYHRCVKTVFAEQDKARVAYKVRGLSYEDLIEFLEPVLALSLNDWETPLLDDRSPMTLHGRLAAISEIAIGVHYEPLEDLVKAGRAIRVWDILASAPQRQHGSCNVRAHERLLPLLLGKQRSKQSQLENFLMVYTMWKGLIAKQSKELGFTAQNELCKRLVKLIIPHMAANPDHSAAAPRVLQMLWRKLGWLLGSSVKSTLQHLCNQKKDERIISLVKWLADANPGYALDALELVTKSGRDAAASKLALHLAQALAPAPGADPQVTDPLLRRLRRNPMLFNVGDAWKNLQTQNPIDKICWDALCREHNIPLVGWAEEL